MFLSSLVTDNITELLVKIIEFTQARQKLLAHNINNSAKPGFVPLDLGVDELAELLNQALNEHVRTGRLLLRDTENVKFGINGNFKLKPVVDDYAKQLLKEDVEQYLVLQTDKLLENSLNQRLAAELLRRKHRMVSIFE
ncbi:MAG: hypothetical protein ACYTEL_19840 [Planctomycetota bacterium]|jgi:flagellar basal body rod protein FlgB